MIQFGIRFKFGNQIGEFFFSLKKSMLKIMEKISCAQWKVSDLIYIALNE